MEVEVSKEIKEFPELSTAISLLYSMPCRQIVSLKNEKVFLVNAEGKEFVLKLLPYPAEETAFITKAMSHLKNRGFADFNEIISTPDGLDAPLFHDTYLLLTKKCHGRIASFHHQSDVEKCGCWLGRMHKAAAGFSPASCPEQRDKWGKMTDIMKTGIEELSFFRQRVLKKHEQDEFDRIFLQLYPLSLKRAETAITKLTPFYSAFSAKSKKIGGFCHHDPAHHNFLIEENTVCAVDFDYAIADTAAHDVAAFLLKVLKTNHYHTDLAFKALDAYEKQRKLSGEENLFIDALLTFPYDFHRAAFARYQEADQSHRIEKKMRRLAAEEEIAAAALAELNKKRREGT